MNQLELTALDGANPLGFLAALGTLVVLSETDSHIRLGWKAKARWTPFLASPKPFDETGILQRLFPCVITCTGSTTAGWNSVLDEACFTWPIWQAPLPPDTIRSLLGHAALVTRDIPSTLRHLGIAAAYRSRRIENGDYVNFSPAQGVL